MASAEQIEANRSNSKLSTGPSTPEGKRVAAQNATKLGFWSKNILMPSESKSDFDAFEEAILADMKPVGAVEALLAHEVVACAWRLRRVRQVEAEILGEQIVAEKKSVTTLGRAYLNDCRGLGSLSKLARDESRVERSMYRAYHELQRLQAARAGHYVPPPAVAEIDVTVDTPGSEGGVQATREVIEDTGSVRLIEGLVPLESS